MGSLFHRDEINKMTDIKRQDLTPSLTPSPYAYIAFDSDFDIIGRYGVRLYKIFRHMSFQITSWRLRVLLKREV
jgi:hypothetical protein